ncbi:type II toxin-antitoxin system RatA family toxin [Chitinimonas sp. BJB300]|uniref:type II toxin-antitoxin system RatA family toxin n=1 Tax=Chitinimonas sp. BJB300 TaxID=1559339 RepID=UPI000C0E6EAF|nr:type II toxin-antitoxin system RatA family toxin [Chitinimonas sp. BJB300]PHV12452.1 ubiquinone-binding protein [Chitinimonas sp. BJB300]TSJ88576.1 type II toxin-antitoxin system RatA family toxin [Chitinimonas sp. BJB300]
MPQVRKSILVPHPASLMFSLVDQVEDYPSFLPWCGNTQLHRRDAEWTVATIGIDYLGLRSSFTTENHKEADVINMALKEGPFKRLNGSWRFHALTEDACKVEFELDYEFSNSVLEKLVGPVFNKIATTFVDAFVKEADRRHG